MSSFVLKVVDPKVFGVVHADAGPHNRQHHHLLRYVDLLWDLPLDHPGLRVHPNLVVCASFGLSLLLIRGCHKAGGVRERVVPRYILEGVYQVWFVLH